MAENEILFREVNERVQELDARFTSPSTFEIVCECGEDTCFERIAIERGDYEAIRAAVGRFAVVPGHAAEDVERGVDRHDGYDGVQKLRGGAVLGEATGPRPGPEREAGGPGGALLPL